MKKNFCNKCENQGAMALEFALIASIFLPLCMVVFDAGLLVWTKGAMQTAASLTARCAAISSSDCTNPQSFAKAAVSSWLFPNAVSNIVVSPVPTTVCIDNVPFMAVTISYSPWQGSMIISPLGISTLTTVGYFPIAGTACS